MNRHLYWPAVLAAGLLIGACSGDGTAPPEQQPGPQESGVQRVNGPLDAAQEPISEQIFGQIVAGADGTPLAPIAECADNAITFGALDILDAAALAIEQGADTMDPQMALEAGSENIQLAAAQFAQDLQNLFAAMAEGECRESAPDGEGFGNPFEGTPLAPLGEALAPVFDAFPGGDDDDPGAPGEPATLNELSLFFSALNDAFQDGLTQVPDEAKDAPVVGGIFTTLGTTLDDLDTLLFFFANFNDAEATAATQMLVNNLLVNVLTEIVPVNFFEEQAGMEGEFSGQIEDGVAQFADALGELNQLFAPLFDAFQNDLQPVIEPIANEVLPAILGPLTEAIGGGNGDDPGGDGPTGTPLDDIIALLTEAFGDFPPEGGDGGDGPTGTPLDMIINALMDAFGGGGDGDGPTGTPLDDLIAALQGLADGGDNGGDGGPTGTPLDDIIAALQGLADGGDGGNGGDLPFGPDDLGPLADLIELLDPSQLDQLADLLGGGDGGGDGPTGTPLDDLIGLLTGLADGGGDGGDLPFGPEQLGPLAELIELLDPSQLEALTELLGGDLPF